MNIQNFEPHINSKILARGKNYYNSGEVKSLSHDGECWTADVTGSDIYFVSVEVSVGGKILDTDCDCPYDRGDYCKHLVAVFFAIREELANNPIADRVQQCDLSSMTFIEQVESQIGSKSEKELKTLYLPK